MIGMSLLKPANCLSVECHNIDYWKMCQYIDNKCSLTIE